MSEIEKKEEPGWLLPLLKSIGINETFLKYAPAVIGAGVTLWKRDEPWAPLIVVGVAGLYIGAMLYASWFNQNNILKNQDRIKALRQQEKRVIDREKYQLVLAALRDFLCLDQLVSLPQHLTDEWDLIRAEINRAKMPELDLIKSCAKRLDALLNKVQKQCHERSDIASDDLRITIYCKDLNVNAAIRYLREIAREEGWDWVERKSYSCTAKPKVEWTEADIRIRLRSHVESLEDMDGQMVTYAEWDELLDLPPGSTKTHVVSVVLDSNAGSGYEVEVGDNRALFSDPRAY